MIKVETIARKWGNSIGISLPKDVVEKANIKPNREVEIFIQDKNWQRLFNSLAGQI